MTPDYPHKVVTESIRKATHEIAGSFFSISSAAAMLKMSLDKEEDITVIVGHLVEACQNFKYRLGNLVEYTKCREGLLDTRLDIVRFKPFISRVVAECLSFAEDHGVGIDTRWTDAAPETIVSDEFRLAIIVNNLLRSAITSTPAGGQVLFAIGSDAGENITLFLSNMAIAPGNLKADSWYTPEQASVGPAGKAYGLDQTVTQYLVEQIFGGKLILGARQSFGPVAEVTLPTNLHLLNDH